ncbi:tetraacyldisaccharide 4'-kinase [Psychrobacter sp. DM8]|uniref:tetraacyldisaccharide 4'-kinase n=1 Tax=Psychrobacter sp. DM8 TaxID=3440636 RepID=UPI003F506303
MSLEKTMTEAWQRQAAWLWLLLPLSWLYGLLMLLRRQAYKLGIFKSFRAPIPVMVIGNITVGGSGKTPLIIALVKYLQNQDIKVGVISRGYGGDSSQMPALVKADSNPSLVGDEPCLIVGVTQVAMAVCPNRQQAIETLLAAHPDTQLIIADDGLQHYALQRDIEWIVVDDSRGFGNQQLLPTGFLREPMSRFQGACVIHHQKPSEVTSLDKPLSLTMSLQPAKLQRLWPPNSRRLSATPQAGQPVHGVSGIGYPKRFFETLKTLGFEVVEHPYPDHYDFSLVELFEYQDHPIIVTSKDAVKIRALLMQEQILSTQQQALVDRLWVLPVSAVLSDSCYQMLHRQLQALNITVPNTFNH